MEGASEGEKGETDKRGKKTIKGGGDETYGEIR